MASRLRRKPAVVASAYAKISTAVKTESEIPIPDHFRCPISLELMKDPVIVPTGMTYDRRSIEKWLDTGNSTCPVTNQVLANDELIPNHAIRRMIQDWCVANRSFGIERIPTPRMPVAPAQASELLSEIALTSQRRNASRCSELVARVKNLAKESERNRRCFVAAGAGRVLSSSFSEFASVNGVLEEILSAIVAVLPIDEEACWYLGSPEPMEAIVSILKSGDLAGRLNAVLVIRQLMSVTKNRANTLAKTNGLVEALVKLIKEPISPQATKAALVAIYYLVSDEKTAVSFVDMDLVSLLLEILVEPEKSLWEKSLIVLESMLDTEKAREAAREHALAVPVLVKKMFRVSETATELAASALWKLCKRGEECLVEALQVGAFQKLLLLLQVGCSGAGKEKATELLKLLYASKGRLECADALDFRGLKRPF